MGNITKCYDLHAHSDFSDGVLSPKELVLKACEQGVTTLALTDHDTVAGVAPAQQAAQDLPISIIAGVEFSCSWRKRLIHVLGLNIDTLSSELQSACAQQSATRKDRAVAIAEKLSRLGIAGSLEGASHYARKGVITRPHFAQYLVDSGHVSSISAAFKRFLGDGGPADAKVLWPSLDAVCQWIQRSGGAAVVAHPDKYKLTRTKLIELLKDFKMAGGMGVEVVSGQQSPSVTQQLAKITNDLNLLASCGSDFHRPENAWQAMGRVYLPECCQPVWQLW